jgi:hypothetical protein
MSTKWTASIQFLRKAKKIMGTKWTASIQFLGEAKE